MPLDLKDVFSNMSGLLKAQLLLTTSGENKLEKGMKREDIVKDFLEETLPHPYKVSSGEIFDKQGEVSKQCDVIIYNAGMPALKKLRYFPIDSVFGMCEVKTTLDKERLREAVENVSSAKRMKLAVPGAYSGKFKERVYSAIFAFDASASTIRNNLSELYTELAVPKEEQIDLICVLDKFIGIGYPEDQGLTFSQDGKSLTAGQQFIFAEMGSSSLLYFILLMLNGFNKPIIDSPAIIWNYMRHSGFKLF